MFPISSEFEIENIAEKSVAEPQLSLGVNLAFDYKTSRFIMADGSPADNKSDSDKVKQWVELALRTVPKKYKIYDDTFGVDTAGIVGMRNVSFGFMASELQREITEVCKKCPLIQSAMNFEFTRDGGCLEAAFRVVLNSGETEEVKIIV